MKWTGPKSQKWRLTSPDPELISDTGSAAAALLATVSRRWGVRHWERLVIVQWSAVPRAFALNRDLGGGGDTDVHTRCCTAQRRGGVREQERMEQWNRLQQIDRNGRESVCTVNMQEVQKTSFKWFKSLLWWSSIQMHHHYKDDYHIDLIQWQKKQMWLFDILTSCAWGGWLCNTEHFLCACRVEMLKLVWYLHLQSAKTFSSLEIECGDYQPRFPRFKEKGFYVSTVN